MDEDCGANGTLTNTAAANSFDCTFPDGPASSTVSATANDHDPANNIGSDSKTVTVANVAPTSNAGGPYSGPWGSLIHFSGNATDPAGSRDTLTYDWDFDYTAGTFIADASGDLKTPNYTYASPGTYTVALRVTDEDGGVSSISTAQVTIGKRATTLAYIGDVDKQYTDRATVSARLTDSANSSVIAGKTVTFTIGTGASAQTATASTGVNGIASTMIQLNQQAATTTVTAAFGTTDANYGPSSDSKPFTVKQEDASIEYTGDMIGVTNTNLDPRSDGEGQRRCKLYGGWSRGGRHDR